MGLLNKSKLIEKSRTDENAREKNEQRLFLQTKKKQENKKWIEMAKSKKATKVHRKGQTEAMKQALAQNIGLIFKLSSDKNLCQISRFFQRTKKSIREWRWAFRVGL